MPGGTLSNYCERCGRRVEVRGARPGEDDLGLDRINEAFRYCSTCQRFVGRACCWNSRVHACATCGPAGSDESIISPVDLSARKKIVIRRLADLSESVDDLRKVAKDLDARVAGDVVSSTSAWRDALDAASWLIARADTSRDAVARALWPPPAEPAHDKFEQFREELADLMKAYLAARVSVEEQLRSGRQLGRPGRGRMANWLRDWRGARMLPALLGAGAAILVVAGGLVALGSAPETGILGGQAKPEQTATAGRDAVGPQVSPGAPSPEGGSDPAAPMVRASLDFDMLRVGPLQGASDSISDVAGSVEVVPFPSPFDRSVRMVGEGSHRFCVSIPGLDAREVSVAFDLYAGSAESLPFGAFELGAVPADGPGTATGIPPELVSSLLPERWYHLNARLKADSPATIEIRDDQGGELVGEVVPGSVAAPTATAEGLCLAASGMGSDGELMLDNLRVEQ